jgi:hypothetical protein
MHVNPATSPVTLSELQRDLTQVQRTWIPRRYYVKFASLIVRIVILPP